MLKYGDIALVYIDDKRKYLIKLSEGGILGTDKGFIKHSEIIGRSYGDAVYTSRGYKAYILRPLLIDYYLAGFRRVTQVIYPKDSAFMIYLSGIKPGSKVLEAGVGTGFLTASLAYFVGENGKVYGFDVLEERIKNVYRNLETAGLVDRAVLRVGDVREPVDVPSVDAVFYDLPDPWNAVDTAYAVLKNASPLLIYVPTVNQVEKTVLTLRRHGGFIDIHTYEILLREYAVEEGATRPKTLMIGHTGYIIFARKVER